MESSFIDANAVFALDTVVMFDVVNCDLSMRMFHHWRGFNGKRNPNNSTLMPRHSAMATVSRQQRL